jgi:putative intracellular protease/amidase
MSRPDSPPSNALVIIFEGFNTLDANGPIEVFRKVGRGTKVPITVAAQNEITTSTEGVQMKVAACASASYAL